MPVRLTHRSIVPLVLVVALQAIGAAQEPVLIGIMRKDGLLIPFVQLRGTDISFIADQGDPSMMTAVAKRAAAAEWTLWKRSGENPIAIRLTGRSIVDFGYSSHEVWTTSFKGHSVPHYVVPVEKIGVAARGGVIELPEDLVVHPDADSQSVRALISRLAHSREARLLRSDASHPINKYSPAVRASKIVRLQKLWRRRTNGVDTYYFEATKRYEYLDMLTTGWVVVSAGSLTPRFVTIATSDDIYKQGVYRDVLGVAPLRNRDLWIVESHYYEGESYGIREWPSGKCLGGAGTFKEIEC